MRPGSTAATDVARRLWDRVATGAPGAPDAPETVAVTADRVYSQLNPTLGRWIGVEGFRALLDRALGLARTEYPVLRDLFFLGGEDPVITAAVRDYGAPSVVTGLIGTIAILIELLGRVIGLELALHLVGQVGDPGARDLMQSESSGGRDG